MPPEFWTDPLIQAAFCMAQWTGPARGMIDELREIKAGQLALGLGLKTFQGYTAEVTGNDWEAMQEQRKKERKMLEAAGMTSEPVGEKIFTESVSESIQPGQEQKQEPPAKEEDEDQKRDEDPDKSDQEEGDEE